ncbi:aminoglycoside phosphotransferase family protein [Anaeromicropila herbilytica]|uniref:Aminoglycoside phosphotransferase n=1 Tax=Anaeromicropila herbilytica TaxID=2785025 RepID=A0A7R7EL33_9FIRM|nr:phosphotransferase [Anaeromicropila herbilytica]BCN31015.1 aminoglycoside phosphotransferase [Anaeromicropila herbilytica]
MIEIPLYGTFTVINPIEKGMSGDKKYYIETNNNERLLLRIADISEYEQKKTEYERMNKLSANGVPMPRTIDFGICNADKSVYTLLEWIDGNEVEEIVNRMDEKEQYLMGVESGKILKQIHTLDEHKEIADWSTRYFAIIDERINAFHKEGVAFSGSDKIIAYLEKNRGLLKNRPQCYHHGDYHMGNMILTKRDKLSIIDWHTVDFDNYGDPWYEFNRIGIEYPAFATGQIDGYFENDVPDEFWALLAYYLSASAITSIVWAKYFAPESLGDILKLNSDILDWYDGMKEIVPMWYKK